MAKLFTYQEIAEHNTTESCWIALDGKVYDISKFLYEHPGGDEIIFDLAGQTATEYFEDIGHSDEAFKILKKLYIGDVDKDSKPVAVERHTSSETSGEAWQGNANIVMVIAAIFFYAAYYFANN